MRPAVLRPGITMKRNTIYIDNQSFDLGRKKLLFNANGGDFGECFETVVERLHSQAFGEGEWTVQDYERIVSHKGKVYLVESFMHFNGHFSGFSEGIYEVYGKEIKDADYNELKEKYELAQQ